jgi:hypothetical protein
MAQPLRALVAVIEKVVAGTFNPLRAQVCLLRRLMVLMMGRLALPLRAVDRKTKMTKISSRKKRPLRPLLESGNPLSLTPWKRLLM